MNISNQTGDGLRIDWSNCGEVLAVGGFTRLPNLQCKNEIHFYSKEGQLLHMESLPAQGKPLTALCWGHNDRRLFIAAGFNLFVAWVIKLVAPLQFMCQRVLQKSVRLEKKLNSLPLPSRLRRGVQSLFSPTIKSYIPDPFKLREFVSTPPPGSERLYCTMVRHGEETSGGHYTLYLEYLGGLIPLLKGKRASKLRPDFVIFDPKIKARANAEGETVNHMPSDVEPNSSDSDSDISTDGCGSPRMQRKKRPKQFRAGKVDRSITFRTLDELLYDDNLPENNRLVEVTSNIWGTKFRIVGIAPFLPEGLGHILYKTSLLHLQPRQMTITVTEIVTDGSQSLSRDPNFSPAGHSEDESDQSLEDSILEAGDFYKDEGILVVTENAIVENHGKIVVDVLPSNLTTNHIEDNKVVLDSSDSVVNNVTNSGEKPYRSPVMKNRTLSPATESLAQNNAFNLESSPVLKDKYISQGAKPKVMNCAYASSSPTVECRATSVTEYTSKDSNSSAINGVLRTSLHEEVENIMKTEEDNRWADHANCGIKFIDDDKFELNLVPRENTMISDSSQLTPTTSDHRKRLYLESNAPKDKEDVEEEESTRSCDHRGSVDSSLTEDDNSMELLNGSHSDLLDGLNSPLLPGGSVCLDNPFNDTFEPFAINGAEIEINQTLSLPASPIRRSPKMDSPTRKLREEVLKGKCKHYSPIFKRKSKYSSHGLDSSDDDVISSVEEIRYPHNYKNLETFQKAQLKQKLRRVRSKSEDRTRYPPLGARQFVMHNKAPLWNENSQVYQLDFGGRVTQESAKNFQIEFRGRQVMQFGRIDSNAYTLDFQYPFTAIQAFAVALANVTQRLK